MSAALQQAMADLSAPPPDQHLASSSATSSIGPVVKEQGNDLCQDAGVGSDEEFYEAARAELCSAASAGAGNGGCSAAGGDAAAGDAGAHSAGTAAAGGHLVSYSMPDAPARRFYDLDWQVHQGDELTVLLRPVRLVTRRQLPSVISEDAARSEADLTCAYGVRHAYTMDIEWSKGAAVSGELPPAHHVLVQAILEFLFEELAQQVQGLVDCPGHSLVVVGDAAQCRMALVNDSKHWAEEMGTCPRTATGSCTCERYINRQPNVRYEHLLYRASDGSYLPALAVFTNTAIPAGAELLARYCTGGGADDSFWGVMRTNIRQYNYIRNLQLQVEEAQALAEGVLES
eukprot:gene4316-4569_t